VIEFNMDGTIVTANDNFLKCGGQFPERDAGAAPPQFVEPLERDGTDYRDFGARLKRGQYAKRTAGRIAWPVAKSEPELAKTILGEIRISDLALTLRV
jgi:methyl-accepting chemotaxis protein